MPASRLDTGSTTSEWTPFSRTSILWAESGRMVWPFSCQMRSGVGRPLTCRSTVHATEPALLHDEVTGRLQEGGGGVQGTGREPPTLGLGSPCTLQVKVTATPSNTFRCFSFWAKAGGAPPWPAASSSCCTSSTRRLAPPAAAEFQDAIIIHREETNTAATHPSRDFKVLDHGVFGALDVRVRGVVRTYTVPFPRGSPRALTPGLEGVIGLQGDEGSMEDRSPEGLRKGGGGGGKEGEEGESRLEVLEKGGRVTRLKALWEAGGDSGEERLEPEEPEERAAA
ncbi:hypothetical protein CRUP_035005 [Coryphaenoides rupestris]|nr:hypothetical protein CRUP_035005 [Coryphaenoides rupestris]